MSDFYLQLKQEHLDVATALLGDRDIPFVLFNDSQVTMHLPSKINLYDAKMEFAKSMGCKSLTEAIDKCGGRLHFDLKFNKQL